MVKFSGCWQFVEFEGLPEGLMDELDGNVVCIADEELEELANLPAGSVTAGMKVTVRIANPSTEIEKAVNGLQGTIV